jgi:D-alanyl-D-alanine carboxypeptidase
VGIQLHHLYPEFLATVSLFKFVVSARVRGSIFLAIALSIALSAPGATSAAPPTSGVAPEIAAVLDAAMVRARRASGASGLAVAVVANDGRAWTDASGLAGPGRPLSQDAPFAIGSVTKTFTAALVLALVDEGRIELDVPVTRYLPNVRMARGVTVRQLLTHTSGIADLYRPLKGHLKQRPQGRLSSNDVLSSIGPRWFKPGGGYAYSNTNYFLLGHVIEAVTHRSYAEELALRFTGPMGLEQTRLLTRDDKLLPWGWSSAFWTAGAMQSTPLELASWGQDLFRARAVSYTSTRRMRDYNAGHRYGHGTQLFRIAGRDLPGHSGLLYGTTTLMVHLTEEKVTVVLYAPAPGVDLEAALAGRFRGGPSLLDAVRLLRT